MRDEYVDVGYGEGGASSWDHSIGSSEDDNHLKYLHRTRAVAIHRTRRQAIRSFAGLDLEQDKDEIEVDLNKKITQKKTKVAKDSTLKSIEEYLQSTIGKDRNAHNNKYKYLQEYCKNAQIEFTFSAFLTYLRKQPLKSIVALNNVFRGIIEGKEGGHK